MVLFCCSYQTQYFRLINIFCPNLKAPINIEVQGIQQSSDPGRNIEVDQLPLVQKEQILLLKGLNYNAGEIFDFEGKRFLAGPLLQGTDCQCCFEITQV